ncbi:MAG: PepSY domain-containing protein [Alphaproteobacteria bacterium]|nr:PepSY domain-containing protein [Alphaproteobacteria bacterium]
MNAPFLDPKTTERRRRSAKLRAALVRWHRRIGITAAVFVLILSVTGILLSHAERLRLHETKISPALAAALYDAKENVRPIGVESPAGWIVSIGETLYLDGRKLDQNLDTLTGLAATEDILAVAGTSNILLLTLDGEFIEKLNAATLPGPVDRIGIAPDSNILLESRGTHYITTSDFLEWQTIPTLPSDVQWSAPTQAIPGQVREAALASHGIVEVTTHRFVADLHSGRTFGPMGPFIMDISAILLIFLSLSGFYMWWRQRRARIQNQRLTDKIR